MRIYLKTEGHELTSAIDAQVRRQLTRNLAGSQDHILGVDVFLEEVKNAEGEVEKKALVCVQLASRLAVRFEAVHSDLSTAVSLAARRAKHAIKRILRRHKRMEKCEKRLFRQYSGDFATS